MNRPSLGCCVDCADVIVHKKLKLGRRQAFAIGAIIVFAAVVWWLLTIFLP